MNSLTTPYDRLAYSANNILRTLHTTHAHQGPVQQWRTGPVWRWACGLSWTWTGLLPPHTPSRGKAGPGSGGGGVKLENLWNTAQINYGGWGEFRWRLVSRSNSNLIILTKMGAIPSICLFTARQWSIPGMRTSCRQWRGVRAFEEQPSQTGCGQPRGLLVRGLHKTNSQTTKCNYSPQFASWESSFWWFW